MKFEDAVQQAAALASKLESLALAEHSDALVIHMALLITARTHLYRFEASVEPADLADWRSHVAMVERFVATEIKMIGITDAPAPDGQTIRAINLADARKGKPS